VATPSFASIKRAVKQCLKDRKEIQAAYVFGSAAKGRMRRDSDIDIAVLLDTKIKPSRFLEYRLALMSDLGRALHRSNVDVVILNEATPLLAHRVLSQGKLVVEGSSSARIRFQVQTASRYLDLIPMFDTHIRYLKKSVQEVRIVG
jgi:predicted nucleotidyltransferase